MTTKKAETAREALLMAAELLTKRGAWTKGWFAKTSSGKCVEPIDDDAARWCGVGAIRRATGDLNPVCEQAWRLFDRYTQQQFDAPLAYSWNDQQTSKRPVIAALRKAADL